MTRPTRPGRAISSYASRLLRQRGVVTGPDPSRGRRVARPAALGSSIFLVGPAKFNLGQPHVLGDRAQLVANLEHAGGLYAGSRFRLTMISSFSVPGIRGLIFNGGTSSVLARLQDALLGNRPVNMRYIVAPRL